MDGPLDSAHGEAASKQPIHNRSGDSMRETTHTMSHAAKQWSITLPHKASPSRRAVHHTPRATVTHHARPRRAGSLGGGCPSTTGGVPPLHRHRAASCPLYPSPRRRSPTSSGSRSSARPTPPSALAPMRRRRHQHGPSRRQTACISPPYARHVQWPQPAAVRPSPGPCTTAGNGCRAAMLQPVPRAPRQASPPPKTIVCKMHPAVPALPYPQHTQCPAPTYLPKEPWPIVSSRMYGPREVALEGRGIVPPGRQAARRGKTNLLPLPLPPSQRISSRAAGGGGATGTQPPVHR